MKKKTNFIAIKILVIIIINYFLMRYFGYLYLNRLNIFIKENNNIMVKNKLNTIIKNNAISTNKALYNIIYNDKKEIINISLDMNEVNDYLSKYISVLNNSLKDVNYNYLKKYYDSFNIKNNKYYLLPFGMISSNPFFYNTGPKVIMSYEYINTPTLRLSVSIKNYGLNNALAQTFLYIEIDQNILKPILKHVSTYKYKFLLSSNIINGRVPSYLGSSLNIESDSMSNI